MLRYTGFLPNDPAVYREFFRKNVEVGQKRMLEHTPHVPAVAGFEAAIKSDPVMLTLFNEVFMQAVRVPDIPAIENFDQLLFVMDGIVSQAPTFYYAEDDKGNVTGEPIGIPIYLLFDLFSNTRAAYDLFRMTAFNAAMKRLLDIWGEYLVTKDSTSVLHDGPGGWFSPLAMKLLDGGRLKGDFNSTYVVPNPTSVTRGYISWDDFFTREVQAHARPIIAADDLSLIHNACESTVFQIQQDVKLHDQFWLKSRPYSLYDMLDKNADDAIKFVGGTVYQASLGPQDYHRWHSPINGTVIKVANVPGTYYAVIPDEGAAVDDPDLKPNDPHGALFRSQGYLTLSAARALIFIKSPNPDIGLMCFIGIGMCEVSTCQISVKAGDKVAVGQELGMFHFGGSSHALIFGPQAKVTFSDIVQKDKHIHVNTILAQVQ
ncbi:phosphatidylserine decarboxylase [Panaeolus papilionaceus]|nr:phosphatidylserine decarboxylase [Panaeolus papilionaceus]